MAKKIPKDEEEYYFATFNTYVGRSTLGHRLVELGFFSPSANDEERIKTNCAITLLRRCGIWKAENVEEIVEALFKIGRK